jgi:hypothetical protein
MTAMAEAFVPGGTRLEPGTDSPRPFAEALVDLVHLAPVAAAIPILTPPRVEGFVPQAGIAQACQDDRLLTSPAPG